ncbi:MAG: hemerythrin domain-containing protein [Catenulispora sp.]|nr:hemerythrin domain-containing protein [Catenulispora sp.]
MTTTESPTGRIDFTMMYLTHEAFRRDLDRLRDAVAEGRAGSAGVQAGWRNFKRQLDVHHTVEDEALWPRVQAAAAGRSDAAEILAAMAAEHGRLDSLLAAVDEAMAQGSAALPEIVAGLAAGLDGHMRHEEEAALPLIQDLLEPKDWAEFSKAMARKQKFSGAAMYVPWVLDGATDEQRAAFFHVMPAPVKVVNRLLWEGRYHARRPWA